MAKEISLKHKETGVSETGLYGWSWTTLLFGPFPALFRGDVLVFFVSFFIYLLSLALSFTGVGLILSLAGHFWWCSYYNQFYTRRLLNEGYRLVGTSEQIHSVASKLKKDDEETAGFINTFSDASVSLSVGLRKCPFCAEQVKAEAIVCRFCQRDLPPMKDASTPPSDIHGHKKDMFSAEQKTIMERFGIEYVDGLFVYEGRGYSTLSDIPFGKKNG
jgi:hypothetical protein